MGQRRDANQPDAQRLTRLAHDLERSEKQAIWFRAPLREPGSAHVGTAFAGGQFTSMLKRTPGRRYKGRRQSEDRARDRPANRLPELQHLDQADQSLAAPLVAETKRRFERQLADKEEQFGQREAKLKQAEQELAKSRETIDERVATQLKAERSRIAEAEAKRARLALADELGERDQRLAEMQQILAANSEKLASAQKAQADLIRKQRELDDANERYGFTIEKRVQEGSAVRDQAKQEAEAALPCRSPRRKNRSPSCSARSRTCGARPSKARSSYRARSWNSSSKPCFAAIFRATRSSRFRRASSAATCSIACSVPPAQLWIDPWDPSGPRTGVTAGSPSSARTSAPQRPNSR